MPKRYPREFCDDVVRVARRRDPGVTLEQIAADFGIHPMKLSTRLRQAKIDDGTGPGVSSKESEENRQLRRRVKLLEQKNEVLRRAAADLSQANLPPNDVPARLRARRRRVPRHGDVPAAASPNPPVTGPCSRPI